MNLNLLERKRLYFGLQALSEMMPGAQAKHAYYITYSGMLPKLAMHSWIFEQHRLANLSETERFKIKKVVITPRVEPDITVTQTNPELLSIDIPKEPRESARQGILACIENSLIDVVQKGWVPDLILFDVDATRFEHAHWYGEVVALLRTHNQQDIPIFVLEQLTKHMGSTRLLQNCDHSFSISLIGGSVVGTNYFVIQRGKHRCQEDVPKDRRSACWTEDDFNNGDLHRENTAFAIGLFNDQ